METISNRSDLELKPNPQQAQTMGTNFKDFPDSSM